MVQAAARGLAKVVGIVVLAVVLVIVVLGLLFARGVLGLDDYVVRTVVGSFQHYIVPEIGFEEFSYDPPYTVMLTGVTFTATGGSGGEGEDGSGTGDAVEVVRASEAKLKPRLRPVASGGTKRAALAKKSQRACALRTRGGALQKSPLGAVARLQAAHKA